MYCGYSSGQASYSLALTAAPQPRSGLEAAIESVITAAAHPLELPDAYLWRSYETMWQRAYVATQMQNLLQSSAINSYGVTTYTATAPKAHGSSGTKAETPIYEAQPLAFLSPTRPKSQFVADAAAVAGFVQETFLRTTHRELPEDIIITVAPRKTLQQLHSQFFNPGVAGLSLNGSRREVFAAAGSLDEVMLVIGHELGHVLSPALSNGRSEEAKAFAFEMAWAQAIFEHNTGGLRQSINSAALSMKPAQNGLHDLAFAFVKAAAMAGKEPLQLHSQISLQHDFDIDFESEFRATAATAAAATPISYAPLTNSTPHRAGYHSGGYRNKSRVQNVPWMNNFSWADLGTGIYGMYIPLTASIFMNDRLLRTDLEQFHKTLGHEYVLHHVMQLPDNYVTKILEDTIFWVKEDKDNYKP